MYTWDQVCVWMILKDKWRKKLTEEVLLGDSTR